MFPWHGSARHCKSKETSPGYLCKWNVWLKITGVAVPKKEKTGLIGQERSFVTQVNSLYCTVLKHSPQALLYTWKPTSKISSYRSESCRLGKLNVLSSIYSEHILFCPGPKILSLRIWSVSPYFSVSAANILDAVSHWIPFLTSSLLYCRSCLRTVAEKINTNVPLAAAV
jgi:hypothetical protein